MPEVTVTIRVDPESLRRFWREMDRSLRALNRLRYPPKEPARGSVSRRQEKLRKAGIRGR